MLISDHLPSINPPTCLSTLLKPCSFYRRGIFLRTRRILGGCAFRPLRALGVHGRRDIVESPNVDLGLRYFLSDEKRFITLLRPKAHTQVLGNG